jgi:hypothetical protein
MRVWTRRRGVQVLRGILGEAATPPVCEPEKVPELAPEVATSFGAFHEILRALSPAICDNQPLHDGDLLWSEWMNFSEALRRTGELSELPSSQFVWELENFLDESEREALRLLFIESPALVLADYNDIMFEYLRARVPPHKPREFSTRCGSRRLMTRWVWPARLSVLWPFTTTFSDRMRHKGEACDVMLLNHTFRVVCAIQGHSPAMRARTACPRSQVLLPVIDALCVLYSLSPGTGPSSGPETLAAHSERIVRALDTLEETQAVVTRYLDVPPKLLEMLQQTVSDYYKQTTDLSWFLYTRRISAAHIFAAVMYSVLLEFMSDKFFASEWTTASLRAHVHTLWVYGGSRARPPNVTGLTDAVLRVRRESPVLRSVVQGSNATVDYSPLMVNLLVSLNRRQDNWEGFE